MVELASLNSVVDRLVHACWNRLFMAWWTNRLEQRYWNYYDKSTVLFINDKTCCQELGCCIKSGFACSNIREQPLSIRQAIYNMLKHDWTILIFYQSCSIMLTVLLQGCWVNPVIASCDIFTRVASGYSAYLPQLSGHLFILRISFYWSITCSNCLMQPSYIKPEIN